MTATKNQDVYALVTNQILEDLDKGIRPWASDRWTRAGGIMPRRSNGAQYRGINIILLWMAAERNGFSQSCWLTYKQAQALGASVRKGEKSTPIVFFKPLECDDKRKGHEGEKLSIPMARSYRVFNAEQIDGLPADFLATNGVVGDGRSDIPAEAFFGAVGANLDHGGQSAFYRPSTDRIQMPPRPSFVSGDAYAATLAHEHIHWTGHESRLAREFGLRQTAQYAKEELIAELGAAFLCASLGIAPTMREDHAAYLAHWVAALREDKRAIVRAASAAQKASDFLHAAAGVEQQSAAA